MKLVTFGVIAVCLLAITWVLTALVLWQINPADWTAGVRAIALVLWGLALLITHTETNQLKSLKSKPSYPLNLKGTLAYPTIEDARAALNEFRLGRGMVFRIIDRGYRLYHINALTNELEPLPLDEAIIFEKSLNNRL